jgi:hypothetical protein
MYQGIEEHGLEDTESFIKPEVSEQVKAERAVIKGFLDHIFQYDPNRHIRACYKTYKDKEMNLRDTRYLIPSDVQKELRPLIENSPSVDLFSNYNRFYNLYYNEIFGLTYKLFGFDGAVDFAINPYAFGTKEELEKWQEEHEQEMRVKTSLVKAGHWTCIAPYRENNANVKYRIDKKDAAIIDINKAMNNTNYDKIRNEMTKMKAEKMQEKVNLTQEDKTALSSYGENMGIEDIIEGALEPKGELPDDALEYQVIVHDAATGKTQEGALHFKDRWIGKKDWSTYSNLLVSLFFVSWLRDLYLPLG